METKYAFLVPNASTPRCIPIVDGVAARHVLTKARAKAEGYTILAWPEDPVGAVHPDVLPAYLPDPPDPATVARTARLEALQAAPEAAGVDPSVVADFAVGDVPIAQARAFMRGLTPSAIRSQFSLSNPKEDSPMTEVNTPVEDARAKRLRELKEAARPTRAGQTAAFVASANTADDRERLVGIKVDGIRSRVDSGRARPGDHAKLKAIKSAEILARANGISLVAALAVSGFTFD